MRHALAATLLPPATLLAVWLLMPGYSLHWDDNAIYFDPLIRAAQERVWSGDLPFWKHTTLLGAPLFAEGQPGALYPLYSAAWLLEKLWPGRLIELIALLHAALGGLGMFLLARKLVRHPDAALLAGVSYGVNGFWLACAKGWIVMPVLQSWLPLLCWATLRAMGGGRADGKKIAFASALWAVHAYSGYPHYALLNAGLMGLAALAFAVREGQPGKVWRAFAILVPAGLMAAPLWLPMRTFAEESIRASGMLSFEKAVNFSLPPSRLAGAAFPHWASPNNYKYVFGFFGAPALLLAFGGVIAGAKRRPLWWWIAVAFALVGLPLTLGENMPGTVWIFKLPILNLFRWPFKNLYVLHCAGTLAAAGGMAWVLARPKRAIVLLRLCEASVAILAVISAKLFLEGMAGETGSGPLMWAWPVSAAGFGLAWGARKNRRFRRAAGWIVALASLLTLGLAAASLKDFAVYKQGLEPAGEFVKSLQGPNRTFIAGSYADEADSAPKPKAGQAVPRADGRDVPPAAWRAYCLPDAGGGPPSANGYSPIVPRRYADFMGVDMFAFFRPSVRGEMLGILRQGAFLDMLSVGTTFVHALDYPANKALDEGGNKPVQASKWVIAWVNPDPMPRAFFPEKLEAVASDKAALEAVHSAGERLRTTAFVLKGGAEELRAGPGKVLDYKELPDAFRVECETEGPAFLVVNSSWAPGWLAMVDGKPARLEPANYGLLGVQIDGAGSHVVELSYEPPDFALGCVLAVLAAGFFLLWTVRGAQEPE